MYRRSLWSQRSPAASIHPLFAAAAPGVAIAGDDTLAVESCRVSLRSALRLLADVTPLDGEEIGGPPRKNTFMPAKSRCRQLRLGILSYPGRRGPQPEHRGFRQLGATSQAVGGEFEAEDSSLVEAENGS